MLRLKVLLFFTQEFIKSCWSFSSACFRFFNKTMTTMKVFNPFLFREFNVSLLHTAFLIFSNEMAFMSKCKIFWQTCSCQSYLCSSQNKNSYSSHILWTRGFTSSYLFAFGLYAVHRKQIHVFLSLSHIYPPHRRVFFTHDSSSFVLFSLFETSLKLLDLFGAAFLIL